jgi:hypothetical protein
MPDFTKMARGARLYHYDADALRSGGPESAKADFANFPRRIHSLLAGGRYESR